MDADERSEAGPGRTGRRRMAAAVRYPSWVVTRRLPVTDSAMASRSRGGVSPGNPGMAPVSRRRKAGNAAGRGTPAAQSFDFPLAMKP